ncbi:hypothetical protein AM493_16665 [Flavobacterium akiainvivens]|uniref:DUF4260 domain-containing protein n=1 Tax=Flavobacterium akiainvivens TaxID=1202724 RepID=A0A0M8MCU0_9FLAO|nr:DUF4260 domain-containing protein [Flavobacterium akiainvivens]KOS07495.1 hypothetical protein AM493_16665 [Flavobacterium akiainvivens]SFQ63633.1 protein of unknown function [Flavobacterium akiainvivens]
MKNLIKLEEAALFALSLYGFSQLPYAWWWFLVLILAPDLSMLGYLTGNKAGAWAYNLFHHRAVAVVLYVLGIYLNQTQSQLVGIILFAHIAMDRFFGYGLKYGKGFAFTHLGEIGKAKQQ